MDFFHFGPNGRLFGSYLPATGREAEGSNAASVAVLCYPFGQEYIRSHRAYRQLAVLLGRSGVPVLRFDYSSTGDSAGLGVEADPASWIDDVRAAMDEARRRSGAPAVRLAGLRLGGTLAALAACGRGEVERLVLWDPVVSGTDFVDELESHTGVREDGTWWVHGFPITESMRDALRRIDLCEQWDAPEARVVQVLSRPHAEFDALYQALSNRGVEADSHVVPSPWDWNYEDAMGGILLPRDMVRRLVAVMVD